MKLSNKEFREIVIRAQAGDNEAMTDILEMYMPLINKHSFVNGKLDGAAEVWYGNRKMR